MKKTISLLFACILLALLISCAGQKSTEVALVLPMKAKFDIKDYKNVYLTNLYVLKNYQVDQDVDLDPNEEILSYMKNQLSNLSDLHIKEVNIAYQVANDKDYETFVKNPDNWKNLKIDDKKNSLIFTGKVEFTNSDASGFFPREVTDQRTGVRRTITVKEDKIEVGLGLYVYVVSAETGEIVYTEIFKETSTFSETRKVTTPMFYFVFERFAPKIENILISRKIKGTRFLITP